MTTSYRIAVCLALFQSAFAIGQLDHTDLALFEVAPIKQKEACHFPEWVIDNTALYHDFKGVLRNMDRFYNRLQQGDTMFLLDTQIPRMHDGEYFLSTHEYIASAPPLTTIRKSLSSDEKVFIHPVYSVKAYYGFGEQRSGLRRFVSEHIASIAAFERLAAGMYVGLFASTPDVVSIWLTSERKFTDYKRQQFAEDRTPATGRSFALTTEAAATMPTIQVEDRLLSKDELEEQHLMERWLLTRSMAQPYMTDKIKLSFSNVDKINVAVVVEESAENDETIKRKLVAESPISEGSRIKSHRELTERAVDADVGVLVVTLDTICHRNMSVARYVRGVLKDLVVPEATDYDAMVSFYNDITSNGRKLHYNEVQHMLSRGRVHAGSFPSLYVRHKGTDHVWKFVNTKRISREVYISYPVPVAGVRLDDQLDEEARTDFYTFFGNEVEVVQQ